MGRAEIVTSESWRHQVNGTSGSGPAAPRVAHDMGEQVEDDDEQVAGNGSRLS